MVGLRDLDLVFKIRYSAQAPYHYRGMVFLGKIHREPFKGHHRHIEDILGALLQKRHALFQSKQRILGAVFQHTDHKLVHHFGCALDNV